MTELTHSMAHYLFAIHKLKEVNGIVRSIDIARDLNLTKGSVSIAISNLKKKHYVEENNKLLSLTKRGHDAVHDLLTSRCLLFYFLRDVLSVAPKNAIKDACNMEHLLSAEAQNKLFLFMKEQKRNKKDVWSNYNSLKDFKASQEGDGLYKI